MYKREQVDEYQIEEFLGDGWFPIERNSFNKWVVWSKKEVFLNFPAQHSGFSLEISGCPTKALGLIVYHKGKEISICESTNARNTIKIPSGVTGCKIKSKTTWIPKEILGTTDERELGIGLHNIKPLELYLETCAWFPQTIEMGLTGICNIKPPCVMCITQNSNYQIKKSQLTENIINKIKPYFNYAKVISLHGTQGEPLLSSQLFNVLNMIDTKNVYTIFATNGLLLTQEMSKRLILAGLGEINFSIDAAHAATYKKIRRNDGFSILSDNIKQLVKLKKEYGVSFPNIIINMVIMEENMFEIPDFIDFAHAIGISTVLLRLLVPIAENYEINTEDFYFNYFKQRIDPNSEEFRQIISIAKNRAKQYDINIVSDDPEINILLNEELLASNRFPHLDQVEITLTGDIKKNDLLGIKQSLKCRFPWEHIIIDLNGDFRFCCHSTWFLGNLNDNNFIEIWNGEIAQKIRGSFLQGQFPDGCLACPLHLPQSQIWQVKRSRK